MNGMVVMSLRAPDIIPAFGAKLTSVHVYRITNSKINISLSSSFPQYLSAYISTGLGEAIWICM